VGVVLGHREPGPPAEFYAAYDVIPLNWEQGTATLETAYNCSVPCKYALRMPGGAAIKFSEDPVVPVHRFDPATGFIGYFSGPKCVWGVHAVTGEVRQNWTPGK
jgi:hypothetical protein